MTEAKDTIEVLAACINISSAAAGIKGKSNRLGQQHVERNCLWVKDLAGKVPNTLILPVELKGESVHVLLDSGSKADLISSDIVDQLRLNKCTLTKPLQL